MDEQKIAEIVDDSLKHKRIVFKELDATGWCRKESCIKHGSCTSCFKQWQIKALLALIAEDRAGLVEALMRAKTTIEQYVKDAGGCDHLVGICACEDIRLLEDIDNLLKGEKVKPQYWKCETCKAIFSVIVNDSQKYYQVKSCPYCGYSVIHVAKIDAAIEGRK